jgi:hypothetical protein
VGGTKVWQLRFEPDSWLVRRFIDDMDFWYEPTRRELLRYTGVTTVPIDGDAKRRVRIDFRYPKS